MTSREGDGSIGELAAHEPGELAYVRRSRLAWAAVVALFGPLLLGMAIAAAAGGSWRVGGGIALLAGLVYLGGFGALAVRIGACHPLILGAMAGEGFALGGLPRSGGVLGVVLAVGSGMLGGWLAGTFTELERPPRDGARFLAGLAVLFGIPLLALGAGGHWLAVVVTAALVAAVAAGYSAPVRRGLVPPDERRALAAAGAASVAAMVAVAVLTEVAIARTAPVGRPVDAVHELLGLSRDDGMTYGDFVRTRYAEQTDCPGLEREGFTFEALPQGTFDGGLPSGDGGYDVMLSYREPPRRCWPLGSVIIGTVVGPNLRARVLDCDLRERRGEMSPANCEPYLLLPERAGVEGPLPSVTWLEDFRSGAAP